MRLSDAFAAGFIALGFGTVSYVMLRIEPGMGFVTPADFFDPVKVAAGYRSTIWLVENFIYLALPLAILVLARSSQDEVVTVSGVIAAVLFLVLGALDRVGIQLPSLVGGDDEVLAAVATMLPIRAAVLKATVAALGVFAWSTTRANGRAGIGLRIWRAVGWVALGAGVVFLFVFVPAPLVFLVWGIGLTARTVLGPDKGQGDVW